MSIVSRRPRVKAISSAVLEASATSCVEAFESMVSNLIQTLDTGSRAAWAASNQRLPTRRIPVLLSLPTIRAQMPRVDEGVRREVASHGLTDVESARLRALMTLQTAPYTCEADLLRIPMQTLAEARTEAEVNTASKHLREVAENGHRELMTRALVKACENASIQAGFSSVDTMRGMNGVMRVVASDDSGRGLVTEIRMDPQYEPLLETEVVGVTDGSCARVMDQFDQALQEQGVRTATPARKPTGGVCELTAARELLRKLQPGRTTKLDDRVRLRKLNQPSKVRLS